MSEVKMNKMGSMPIWKLLFTMSGPAILSMFINALYNIVDSIFVAQLGEDSLTAVTIAYPVQFLMIAIAVGTGVGLSSLISRRLGAGKIEQASTAANSGLKLGFFNWLLFLIFGIFGSRLFTEIFTTDSNIMEQGVSYLSIVSIFSFFVMIEILMEKIFQGTGNMIYPMIMMISGVLTNTIIDPILIFGLFGAPKLGVSGAAISTVFAQFVAFCIGIYFIKKKNTPLDINIFKSRINWHTVKEIYAVGAPTILMQAIGSVMIFILNMILVVYSTTAVAVLGIYGRLQMFIFMPAFGLNQGALPIMGYNYGAKNKVRLLETYKKANIIVFVIMAVGFAIFQLFPEFLLSLFNASPTMYEIGTVAIRTISICFIPAGFGIVSASLLQATGHGMSSMWGAVLRQLAAIVPMAYIFGKIGGVNLIWYAFPLAEIVGFSYYLILIIYLNKTSFSKLEVLDHE